MRREAPATLRRLRKKPFSETENLRNLGRFLRPNPILVAFDVLAQFGWALVAGPLQVTALGMSAVGLDGPAIGLQSRVLRQQAAPIRGHLTVLGRTAAALPVALFTSILTLVVLMILGRGALYPLWALRASHHELAGSWGGPSPLGATAVHLLGAMAVGLMGLLLLRILRTAHARLLFRPTP